MTEIRGGGEEGVEGDERKGTRTIKRCAGSISKGII